LANQQAQQVALTYTLRPFDAFEMRIFTNQGQLMVQPEPVGVETANTNANNIQRQPPEFMLDSLGQVVLPAIGIQKLDGLTVMEAQKRLSKLYELYYKDAFVSIRIVSHRVTILGAPGGQVIPLPYQGMSLLEVLALAGGLSQVGRTDNIRLIRNAMTEDQKLMFLDLSTVQGLSQASLRVEPGDIIYIQPRLNLFSQSIRDAVSVTAALTSVVTIIILLTR